MEQKQLGEMENRCIEEAAPWCIAACPLHVDGRDLCSRVETGDWSAAWKVLQRSMPFAGILGRICDAPCQGKCKRAQAGGGIALNMIERAVVSHPAPPRPLMPLPARHEPVAVVGAGLAGLTVAWDLARKGYPVTIYEPGPRLAHALRQLWATSVPDETVETELEPFGKLGVRVELNAPVDGLGSLDRLAKDAQAVFLSLDVLDLNDWPLPRDGQGRPCIPSPAQTTQRDGVFAGGLDRPDGPSPVWQASEGRWAATSMDRSLQSVSLSAGRGKETPYESRLFTSLEGVLPMPVTPAAGADGYDQAEARQEASRCLKCHCLECVKVCPYLEEFKAYPKKYVREIYNNQSIVMGVRQANKLINSCSLCGLCQAVCPGGFAMQTLCLDTRRDMVEKGKMPPSAHEFALLDMAFSLGSEFLLARHQPGQGSSAALFFPGCQLAASDPGQVRRVYEYLCAALSGGVGLMLACCGAPAHWAGRRAEMEAALAAWQKDWEALGRPPVIMACASCLDIFRQYLPQVERRSLWEVLVETDLPPGQAPVGPLAVHDPCTTRHEPGIRRHLRALLAGRGVELKELKLGGELTECCGYGGLMSIANPPLAQKVIAWRASQSERDYLAYCAVCRDRLAATGKRALHALDILFPDPAVPDPAARLGPGWSQRRENRARLKVGLLRDLWGEEAPAMAAHRALKLILAPEVAELLEKRRILIEDVQQVIYQAEHGGKKLSHPDTGRFLACFKPYKAVFWVEYSPEEEDAFRVHNAYAHRMTVKPGGSS